MSQKDQADLCTNLWYLYLNNLSWASPQILATLSIIDRNFEEKISTIENEDTIKNEVEPFLTELKKGKQSFGTTESFAFDWRNRILQLTHKNYGN